MIKDQSAELIEGMFADSVTHDPYLNSLVKDPKLDLPEEFTEDVSNLARWLIAVVKTTKTSDAAGRNARKRAMHSEDGRLRTLLRNGHFIPNALTPLHNRLAEAIVNAESIGNVLARDQINEFLNAQAGRQVASSEHQQMPQTG